MELSTKMLSQINDAAQMTRLSRILAQIRRDINGKKMCMLQGSTQYTHINVVNYIIKIVNFPRGKQHNTALRCTTIS